MAKHEGETACVGPRSWRRAAPSTRRSNQRAACSAAARTKCAQIIGVTDSDTRVEIAIANTSVTENSRNSRPTMPPMNSSGMNAAISDTLIEITVKPICRAPSSAARNGVGPLSRLRKMFSIITMASSTTKPTETASAISDRLSIEKPASHIAAQVPASDSGTVTPAARVGVGAPQEQEHDQHHQHDGRAKRELHVVHAGADRLACGRPAPKLEPAGIQRLSSGSNA